jgi:hypothetical protein
MGDAIITIKKGNIEMKFPKDELVEVSETHDGIAFNFKRGLQLYQIEQFMPTHVKQLIANSINTFAGNKIVVDLDNSKRPVMVDNT